MGGVGEERVYLSRGQSSLQRFLTGDALGPLEIGQPWSLDQDTDSHRPGLAGLPLPLLAPFSDSVPGLLGTPPFCELGSKAGLLPAKSPAAPETLLLILKGES